MSNVLFVSTIHYLNSLFNEGKLDEEKILRLAELSLEFGSPQKAFYDVGKYNSQVFREKEANRILESVSR